jgi:hypothetical protein
MNIETQNSLSTFRVTRMKRKLITESDLTGRICPLKSKRNRNHKESANPTDPIADKENFHRSKDLVPRSRSARILVDLIIESPTDCSDIEISDFENDEAFATSAGLYHDQVARMSDISNPHYHFTVFEDSVDSST